MNIVPMRDLKNTVQIEKLCNEERGPVFVTKNGYGALVVMNIDCFEQITKEDYKKEMYALSNVYKKIQNSSGYVPGNVYVFDKEKADSGKYFDSPERYNSEPIGSALFDEHTGNFHIVPKEYNNYLSKISEVEKLVYNNLSEPDFEFEKIIKGKGGKNALSLEKYIGIEKNGFTYYLCFERLYTHKNKVHCMLGTYQYYKFPSKDKNININIVKRSRSENITVFTEVCYPNSFQDGKERINDSKNGEHIVFNPKGLPSVFDTNEKNTSKVCTAFKTFVNSDTVGE